MKTGIFTTGSGFHVLSLVVDYFIDCLDPLFIDYIGYRHITTIAYRFSSWIVLFSVQVKTQSVTMHYKFS